MSERTLKLMDIRELLLHIRAQSSDRQVVHLRVRIDNLRAGCGIARVVRSTVVRAGIHCAGPAVAGFGGGGRPVVAAAGDLLPILLRFDHHTLATFTECSGSDYNQGDVTTLHSGFISFAASFVNFIRPVPSDRIR